MQETAYDFNGQTPLVKTKHHYYTKNRTETYWWLHGREYKTEGYSGAGDLLNQTDTSWDSMNIGNRTDFFVHVDEIETTDYSGGASATTRVTYDAYDDYGNLTSRTEYDENDDPYRQTLWGYYPNTTAHDIWIVSKPGWENVKSRTGSTWELEASTQYAYDGNPRFDGQIGDNANDKGELTAVRLWRGSGVSASERLIDVRYGYDGWGNRISETTFTGYGDYDTFASAGARTTDIVYETAYHLYPMQTCNDLGHCATTEYYGIGGVPADHGQPGQVKQTTGPNDETTVYWYDDFGRLTRMWRPGEDPNTKPPIRYIGYYDVTHPEWYPLLIVTYEKTDSDASSSEFWNGAGSLWTRQFYDGLGRSIQTQTRASDWTPGGGSGQHRIVQDTVYDAMGRVSEQSVPYEMLRHDGSTPHNPYTSPDTSKPHTTTQYDALGRVLQVTGPDGTSTRMDYKGWKTVTIDPNDHQRVQETDAFGQLVNVWEFEGTHTQPNWNTGQAYASTQYDYDVLGNLLTVTDDADNVTTMTYNPLGLKTEMDDPDMGVWSYQYDSAGNLTVQDDAKQQRVCFYYDELNRLEGKRYYADNETDCPDTPTSYDMSYTYDCDGNCPTNNKGVGQRTRMEDGSGYTTWIYDELGRVTKESKTINGAGTFDTEYTYNAAGQVLTMKYPDGEIVTNDYDYQGLLESLDGDDTYVSDIDYNTMGQLKRVAFGNGLETRYGYFGYEFYGLGSGLDLNANTGWGATSFGRLMQTCTVVQGGACPFGESSALLNMSYWYDAVGNVLKIRDRENDNQVQSFNYDSLDRLTDAYTDGQGSGNDHGSYNRSYDYDEIGNIDSKSGLIYNYRPDHPHAAVAVGDTVLGETWASYGYDANGNMTTRTESDIPFGGNDTSSYIQEFNNENRLTAVRKVELLDFGDYPIQSYGGSGQDKNPTVTVEDAGATLHIVGNGWKKIAFPYTVTSDTILEFDFKSGARGEIHGIGFDTDNGTSSNRTFQLYGSQSWGISAFNDYASTAPAWKHYRIPVGEYYTGNMLYLIFANDHDVSNPTGEGLFANIAVYESTTSEVTEFVYDGDGNRVKRTEPDGTMTAYVGGYYEVEFRAPSAPSNLSVATLSTSQLRLTWSGNSDNEDGFKIERSSNGTSGWTQVATVGVNGTSYTNGGLACNTTYYYRARAYNTVGHSAYSNVSSARTSACPSVPNAPSNLSASPTRDRISLTWSDNSSNESGFKVERSLNGMSGWTQIATVGANGTGYTDRPCDEFQQEENAIEGKGGAGTMVRYYRVRAYNGSGNSGYSNVASAGVECRIEFPRLSSIDNGTRAPGLASETRFPGAAPAASSPPNGQTRRSYYYAAGQRVAMREHTNSQNVVQYLHGDHLGSTTLATTSGGTEVPGSRTLYYPYGEERWSASGGTLATDYGFTGQRKEGFGLMDYNARYYDPYLARFISADTIVPDPGNPQDLNRYSYVRNSPLNYQDPTGHAADAGGAGGTREGEDFYSRLINRISGYDEQAEAAQYYYESVKARFYNEIGADEELLPLVPLGEEAALLAWALGGVTVGDEQALDDLVYLLFGDKGERGLPTAFCGGVQFVGPGVTLPNGQTWYEGDLRTADEILDAGQQWLTADGGGYYELGQEGSGVYISNNGTRMFRITSDPVSQTGDLWGHTGHSGAGRLPHANFQPVTPVFGVDGRVISHRPVKNMNVHINITNP
ncbi:MAG: hypothetical protein GY832_46645 [Chloroflexi bacterium]|nr:hypothetical protein [Chloroflexota bacterium]